MVAFVTQVAETIGEEGRYLHYGLTSSDVVDTGLALQCRTAADLILAALDETIAVVHAHGMLGGRDSRVDPLLGTMIGHETVVAELERAADHHRPYLARLLGQLPLAELHRSQKPTSSKTSRRFAPRWFHTA